MDDEQPKRGPGRPRKVDAEAPGEAKSPRARLPRHLDESARRRKPGALARPSRLLLDETKLDRENYEYRWVVDRDARLMQMTQHDDWAVVDQDGEELRETPSELGTAVSVLSGTKKNGEPEHLYLCRKPKAWVEDERRAKEARRREIDDQMRRRAREGADDPSFYATGETKIG